MKCDDWPSYETYPNPDRFLRKLAEVRESVERGDAEILKGTCPLDQAKQPDGWFEESLYWVIRCKSSMKCYSLYANTYHGRSGWSEMSITELANELDRE